MKKMMMKRMFGVLIGCLVVVWQAIAAESKSVESWLQQFEKEKGKERLQIANQLMEKYYQEELTDGLLRFDAKIHSDTLSQQIWYWSAEYFYAVQNFQQALVYGKKALPLCEGTDAEANCLSLMSLICFRLSNYQQAAEYAKWCYRIDERTGDPDIMSSSLNTLAGIYIGANQPKEAENYILKGIELSKKADNPARMAVLLGMASEVYHALGNDAEALRYIDEACQVEKSLKREDKLMVRLAQKASVLIGMHQYQEAERILSEVIPFLREKGNRHSLGIACNKMGMTLLSQEREMDAVPYYREAAAIFVAMGDIHNEMHSRRGLYESLWNHHSDSAKMELDRFNELKDSLYSNATAESMARYNAEFGTDQLRIENEIQRTRTRRAILIGLAGAILLAAGIWWLMWRKLKMREAALQTTIEKLQESEVGVSEEGKEAEKQETLNAADRNFLGQLVLLVMRGMPTGNLSMEWLASEMCISRGQLNRRVKAVTGITLQQYVMRVRMEYARLLMKQSPDVSIFDISCRCGFEDAASFSRAFRRTYDQSPTQYREELLK